MAGDWIKMQTCLPDKPEVWRIASIIGCDPDAVIGKLLRVWAWFDSHTEDGNAVGVTYSLVDRISGVTGFAEAMALCGWLEQRDLILSLPKFDRHNGKTAKNRALTNERVAKTRAKSNAECNGASVTKTVTREEKRREDIKPIITPDKQATKKGTQVPKDFTPNETTIQRAATLGVDWKSELPKFIDHHSNKGTIGKDWDAGFRTWLANSIKFGTAVMAQSTPTPVRPLCDCCGALASRKELNSWYCSKHDKYSIKEVV